MTTFKPYRSILLLALLIRLILMPFLFHPDIKTQYYHARFLQKGVFNIYQYVKQNKETLGYKDTFNYPPLAYFLLGSWNVIISPFIGDSFNQWLVNWGEDWFTNPQIFRQLFLLKLPYLAFDFGIAYLLLRLVPDKFRKKAMVVWLFNPVTLYIIYGLSNFDIIPTFLVLLSLFFYKEEKFWHSGISLGLAIAIKLYPILYLPFFAVPLLSSQKYKPVVGILGGASVTFFVTTAALLKDALSISNSGLLNLALDLKIPLPGLGGLPVICLFYAAILFYSLIRKSWWMDLNFYILAATLALISIVKIHPQWFLWVIPFFIIYASQKLKLLLYIFPLLVGYVLLILSFNDRFLTLGIFSPILPNIYDVGSLEETLFSHVSRLAITSLSQALIFFGCLVTLYVVVKEWQWKKKIY